MYLVVFSGVGSVGLDFVHHFDAYAYDAMFANFQHKKSATTAYQCLILGREVSFESKKKSCKSFDFADVAKFFIFDISDTTKVA